MAFRRIVPLVGVLTFALVTQVPAVAQSPSTEMELLRRVATQPAEISNYLDLAKVYMSGRRFDEAEQSSRERWPSCGRRGFRRRSPT